MITLKEKLQENTEKFSKQLKDEMEKMDENDRIKLQEAIRSLGTIISVDCFSDEARTYASTIISLMATLKVKRIRDFIGIIFNTISILEKQVEMVLEMTNKIANEHNQTDKDAVILKDMMQRTIGLYLCMALKGPIDKVHQMDSDGVITVLQQQFEELGETIRNYSAEVQEQDNEKDFADVITNKVLAKTTNTLH